MPFSNICVGKSTFLRFFTHTILFLEDSEARYTSKEEFQNLFGEEGSAFFGLTAV